MRIEHNYSLLKHNTFGIDAKCQRFVEYESVEEAQELVRSLTEDDYPLLILGGGSNLLLTGDYKGTVVHSGISLSSVSMTIEYVVARLTYGMTL